MSSNSTGSGDNGLSAGNIVSIVSMGVSLCLSFITFLTVIFTCTYIAIRSKFRDKQDTNIKISTETANDGDIKSTLQIGLKNNESYSVNSKKFDNKKKSDQRNVEKKSEGHKDEGHKDDLKDVLNNNHDGDSIIADTRITAIQGAYNTFLKTLKIQALKQDGTNKAPLEVSTIHIKTKENEKKKELFVNIEEVDKNDDQSELLGNNNIIIEDH